MTKIYSLTFTIELYLKSVGVGLTLVLLKDYKFGDPRFFLFFLKGKMIVHEIKTKNKIFNVRFFNI